ncbi:MAG: hypothetical protein WDN27_01515 [Candidatus Saccharibacteria bacterium]
MLFGHQNDDVIKPTAEPVDAPVSAAPAGPPIPPAMDPPPAAPAPAADANPLAVDTSTGYSLPVAPASDTSVPAEPSVLDQPTDSAATAPVVSAEDAAAPDMILPNLTGDTPTDAPVPESAPLTAAGDTPAAAPADDTPVETPSLSLPAAEEAPAASLSADDLLELKQEALTQLTPLVDQLDQTPEEKFRTTMMMIQSTDNQALIKEAYDAAQGITDEKVRAQALLDVVNEINYFTQQKPVA